MPLDSTNVPATFQRMVDLVLGGTAVNLDSIVISCPTVVPHLVDLREVHAANLLAKPKKCAFFETSEFGSYNS